MPGPESGSRLRRTSDERAFDVAMGEFAAANADQNERDYERFVEAARERRIEVTLDV